MSKSLIIILLLISNIIFQVHASIRICNNGAYLAKCWLKSRFPGYGYAVRHTDTGFFAVSQCEILDIPINAVQNRLECKALAFIAVYKTIFVQDFASSSFNFCYETTGVTLAPRWSQTPC